MNPIKKAIVLSFILIAFLASCSAIASDKVSDSLRVSAIRSGLSWQQIYIFLPFLQFQTDDDCAFEVDPQLQGYLGNTQALGCATSPSYTDPVAINEFGSGPDYDRFMFWFSRHDTIEVLFPDRTWQSFEDTWSEADGTFVCNPLGGDPTSPPLPRRGFGKVWCNDNNVQTEMGLIEVEERLCEESIFQEFEHGRLLACIEDSVSRYVAFSDNSRWNMEVLEPERVFSATSISSLSPDAIRFAVIGDYGSGTSEEADVAALVKRWNPDFIVTAGDNNYPVGSQSTIDKHIGQFYAEFIHPYVGDYPIQSPPADPINRFWPALGNHDWDTIECDELGNCAGAYFDYFTLPGNERYYDVVESPVHLFLLDSDEREPDGIDDDSVQAQWLEAQLAASTAEWKIVVLHHAPYSSFRHGPSERLQWPYQEWGADVVISGHDHSYERLIIDGVVYLVNGLGGGSRYRLEEPVPGSRLRYNVEHGALLVEAGSNELTLSFISVSEQMIDAITLSK